ncbi:hypothetical protein ACFL0Y_01335 [Patescibacteria group bacterium]
MSKSKKSIQTDVLLINFTTLGLRKLRFQLEKALHLNNCLGLYQKDLVPQRMD